MDAGLSPQGCIMAAQQSIQRVVQQNSNSQLVENLSRRFRCCVALAYLVPLLLSSCLLFAIPVLPCRQLSTDRIVTLSLAGPAVMTFSCKKKSHDICVELPARTLQVLLCP